MSSTKPLKGRCGRKTVDGGYCQKYPIAGATVCRTHGGAAPQVQAAARKKVEAVAAEKAVALYGLPRRVGPHEALLEEIERTAGHVAWLGEVVAGLRRDELTRGFSKQVQLPDGTRTTEVKAAVNIWLALYQEERAHLVRVSAAAINAGVAERAVRIAEDQAARLAAIVSAVLTDLGHSLNEKKVRESLRLRLTAGPDA